MGFCIKALDPEQFSPLFALSDDELRQLNARRMIATSNPGFPCRVSLADAEIGERVLLVHHTHQNTHGPYRSSHALFVREGATQALLGTGEVPKAFLSRLLSVRLFDNDDMMIGADVVDGPQLATALNAALARAEVAYVHIHFAKPGCFAALASRA